MCFHEVQAFTRQIVLMNRGRLVAFGDVRQIRDLIDAHPHRIVLQSPEPGRSRPSWCGGTMWSGVELRRDDGAIVIETSAPDQFYGRLARPGPRRPIRRSRKCIPTMTTWKPYSSIW